MLDERHHICPDYQQQEVAFTVEPLNLAAALAETGLDEEYLVYECRDAWFVGIGKAAEITLYPDRVELRIGQNCHCWQGQYPAALMIQVTRALSVRKWRLYGTAPFELASYLHKQPLPEQPILSLFLPRFDICLSGHRALLRTQNQDDLARLRDAFRMACLHSQNVDRGQTLAVADSERLICANAANGYAALVGEAVREINQRRYQKVILSRRVELNQPIDMLASFINGRRQNTPARSFVLDLDGLRAAGFSPETLLEVSADGQVSTQPLAGTRALSDNRQENERLQQELTSDPKEVHEHAISVKLAIDELSPVCRPASVAVSEFMQVKKRGSVQHLASRVVGQLRDDYCAWHAFFNLFPAITASGIPKRAAVEAIQRLETGQRQLYSGCVLMVQSDGSLDAALVLRAVYQRQQKTWLQAGAGIVSQSTPEREVEETCEKLRSVSRYLSLA